MYVRSGNKTGINSEGAPAFYNTNVVLSTVATTPCTRTNTTIGGQTVYQTYYETGSLGTDSNVDTVTWYFQNPNNVFRVIITELSSGTITYLSTADDKFLAGEGITCAGSGAQTWNAIVPAIWRKGLNYSVVAQSLSPDFNIMGSYSGSTFIPYAIFTGWLADVQSVVHLPLWSAGTWNAGDVVWNLDTVVGSIYSGGPLCRGNAYVCLVTGAQTGTFASNLSAGKWRKIHEHASLYARRNSTAQSITKLTDTPVLFDTENTLNEYLPTHTGLTYSGGVFTNTSGGEVVVHVSYNFVYAPNNVGDRWSWVRLNGQNGKRLCFSSASSINNVPIGCAGSFNLYMTSGDYFEVMTRHSSNISINLDGAAAGIDAGYSTRISIMRVQ